MFQSHEALRGGSRSSITFAPEDTVDVRGASAILGVSESWLNKLRVARSSESPRFIRLGRRIFYRISDLRAWQEQRMEGGAQ